MTALDERLPRVDKWLLGDGRGLWPISWDAARVLDQRLRARRRANVVWLGFGFVALGALVMSFREPDRAVAEAVRWWVVYVAALATGTLARQVLVTGLDAGIGRGLRRRTASQLRRSVVHEVGWRLSAGAAGMVVLAVGFLIAMLALHIHRLVIVSYGIALVVVLASAALAVARIGSAPVVAVDDGSLAVDARIRVFDFWQAVWPVGLLVASTTTPVGLTGSAGGFLGILVMFGPVSMAVFALSRQSIRTRPRRPTPAIGAANGSPAR